MIKRRLTRCGRRKAPFGTQEAAILSAAAINAATQLISAGINSSATKQAAKDQATAINQQATKQAQAIKDQTSKSREYQQESQEFIKEQNAENRALQKDIQMELQMLTGQQNVNDRLEASKIQVRNGGSIKRRLAKSGSTQYLLRGSDNLPFTVTDGGGVIALGQTPEGYDLYELYGNDHEHYHKAQGGKNKTGVGIKFANGGVIEGEGNQNGSDGEKMLVTPTNAYFISRHTLAGFNPAKAVDKGMNPIKAYALQENIKAAKGISDDGSPVGKMMIGGNFINNLYNENGPQLGVDTIGDTSVGVAYAIQKDKPKLRNGGKLRRKAVGGTAVNNWWNNLTPQQRMNISLGMSNPVQTAAIITNSTGNTTQPIKTITPKSFEHAPYNNNGTSRNVGTTISGSGLWNSADLWGAGIGALGNLGAALITSAANRSAARHLANAQSQAAETLADAYRNLQTIDMNSIRREDYAAAHAMPALQAPVSFANSQTALVDRQLQRRLDNARKYSLSGAASQDRMAEAEIDAQDQRNRIYAADQQQMQQIRQANAERVTQAAMQNAQLDTQANRDYTSAYLDMLQYNNDIENQKILGAAGALSEGYVNASSTLSGARTANAQAWANALVGSSQGFTNSLSAMANRRADLAAALLGAGSDSQASYYATVASRPEAIRAYNALVRQYNATDDADTRKRLGRQINNIASRRGFEMV